MLRIGQYKQITKWGITVGLAFVLVRVAERWELENVVPKNGPSYAVLPYLTSEFFNRLKINILILVSKQIKNHSLNQACS